MKDLRTIPLKKLPNSFQMPSGVWVTYDAVFKAYSPATKEPMVVICSTKHGWDHVSISLEKRCPTWEEMEYIKRLLFKDNEVAMQLHMPPKDHINIHPNVLHLWRPQKKGIPLPPKEMV